MADLVNAFPSWSQSPIAKPLPPTPLKERSYPSSPIPIPRRSVIPPPCSPIRAQHSPDLVFNLDFSVSPDDPDLTPQLVQQRGPGMRFAVHRRTTYAPLAILGTNQHDRAHPYAHEPFLYQVPKLTLRDTHKTNMYADDEVISAPTNDFKGVSSTTQRKISSTSISSFLSFQSSVPSCPPSADTSVDMEGDGDENFPLTSAFQNPLVSASASSSSPQDASFLASMISPPPSPLRSRPFHSPTSSRQTTPIRPIALQRTTTAAPVVSLNVAQAERSNMAFGRSPSPSLHSVQPRARRSSSVGADSGFEKVRDQSRNRRMATVVGRGAGRVVSMFEYGYGTGKSLVSDEDIEWSLEKDVTEEVESEPERGRGPSRRVREYREKVDEQIPLGSPVIHRGRARARPATRGGNHAPKHALTGWQWVDTQ